MTEIRYPNGSVEKREYDKGGRLKRITNPMGVWEEYAYDGNGNIIVVLCQDLAQNKMRSSAS